MLTSVGRIAIARRYWQCRCGAAGSYAADAVLGVDGGRSRPLERHICRLGADVSFAKTREHVAELLGVKLSEESVRDCCEQHGKRMVRWQPQDAETPRQFAAASGAIEFAVDAGKVNTREAGWKDLKIAVFQKRPVAEPCATSAWSSRRLPAATAAVAWADVTQSDRFRGTWRRMASRLGVRKTRDVHVLADGAPWIWRSVSAVLGGCRETLDIFHGLAHVARAGEKLYGEGAAESAEFLSRGRSYLLESGWNGITRLVGEELSGDETPSRRAALDELVNYFSGHMSRLDYASCLAEGRAIGSGVVEGWAKTLGLRLKARGARWRKRNAVGMSALGCVRHSSQWSSYWAT